jgi:hypothetical protein
MGIKLKISISLFILSVLVSCGGGGSGDSPATGGGDQQPDEGVLNPGLQGKIVFVDDNELYTIDADTGDLSFVPNTNWRDQKDRFRYPDVTSFSFNYVEHNGYLFIGYGRQVDGSYVFSQDYNGNILWQFELTGEVLGAELSQDKQYVALFRRLGSVSSTPWFEIYNISGQLIEDRQYEGRQLIWLRDSRLLYSYGRTFQFTKPASLEEDYHLTLPPPDEGTVASGLIGDKAISPDESQIVFTVAESGGNFLFGAQQSRLYIMNIDGSGIRLLATTQNDEDPTIVQPKWSPDGRWILVKAGNYPAAGDNAESLGYRYLIPADDPGKVYYVSTFGSDKSAEVKYFKHHIPDHNSVTTRGSSTTFNWIPD